MRELELHTCVVRFLRYALPEGCVFFHVPNGEYRTKAAARRLKDMATLAGVPDLLFVYDGKLSAIELKAPKKYPTPEQKAVHARLRNAGATVVTCRSLVEVEMALELFGIPLRARVAA